jgi:hypothetical protein
MNGQSNCYRCGAATGVDPCWNCGTSQSCMSCRSPLEGPFCTTCGTPAPAAGPTAASVAATVQGHFQNTSGPAPESPLDLDQVEAYISVRSERFEVRICQNAGGYVYTVATNGLTVTKDGVEIVNDPWPSD